MNRTEYLYHVATLRRIRRDGRITHTEHARRLSALMHVYAGVPDTSGFHRHVDQALEVVR